jgi:hypothetical protein
MLTHKHGCDGQVCSQHVSFQRLGGKPRKPTHKQTDAGETILFAYPITYVIEACKYGFNIFDF